MASFIDSVMQTATVQNKAVSGTSAQSDPIVGTDGPFEIVRIAVTVDTYIERGVNPTASTTTSEFWPAGTVEYKKVNTGEKLAFIRASADGRVTISRMV